MAAAAAFSAAAVMVPLTATPASAAAPHSALTPASAAALNPASATAPTAALNPASATAPTAGLAPASAAGVAARGTASKAAAKADIPCPKPKVKPPTGRPPRPVPPPDDPALRAVGGDALATSGLTVPPGSPAPPAITATTWLVADLDTGEVLGGCGPHVYQTPASVQKLLLAATVMPKLNPKQPMTVAASDLDIEPGSSAVGLVTGGRYSIATLWLGLILNSGNDAANALARLGGGSGGVPATVASMNAEAKRLGAFQTHAVTPSGLDGEGQFTSAYDLALIARVCFDLPDFRNYALVRNAKMPAQKKLKKGGFQFQNENRLIFNYKGALGGKTGFTKLARHSYVGAAQRNGRRLVVTLLGAEASPIRGWQQGAALLDWGFKLPKDASVGKLVDPDTVTTRNTENAPAAVPAPTDQPRPAAAPDRGPSRTLMFAAAAAVAVVLAATPLLLLLTSRRRQRARRRRPSAQTYAGPS